MLLNHVLLTYRVQEKMNGSVKFNEHGKTIKQFAGRKGGRRRVKKGFAKTLTSEKAREYARKRWRGKDSSSGTSTEQEKLEN